MTDAGKALALSRLLTGTWYLRVISGPLATLTTLETQEWSFTIVDGVAVGTANTVTLASRTHIGGVALIHNDTIITTAAIGKVYAAGTSVVIQCNLYF